MYEAGYGNGDLDTVDAVQSAPCGDRWTACENVEGARECVEGKQLRGTLEISWPGFMDTARITSCR